jgi:hypothetical protein
VCFFLPFCRLFSHHLQKEVIRSDSRCSRIDVGKFNTSELLNSPKPDHPLAFLMVNAKKTWFEGADLVAVTMIGTTVTFEGLKLEITFFFGSRGGGSPLG